MLNLKDQKEGNISESVVIEGLEATRYLHYLEVKPGFGSTWSSKVFRSIAQHANIMTLRLPEITENWWKDLERLPRQNFFQNATASYQRANYFLRGVRTPNSTHAMGIAARMLLLTILTLRFGYDSVIKAQDLTMLGENCKRLIDLELGREEDYYEHPRVEDITNATIEYIAVRLTKLEELQFYIQDSPLTEESLISLGAHCKSLESVYLSAEVSFDDLVQNTLPNHFPTLASVSLTQAGSLWQCDDAWTTAGLLLERAPALSVLDFAGSNYPDWELQAAIDELVNVRRPPYLNQPPADEHPADKKTKAETVPHDGFE